MSFIQLKKKKISISSDSIISGDSAVNKDYVDSLVDNESSRLIYKLFIVKEIYYVNQTISSLSGNNGDYIVLTKQNTISENGLYLYGTSYVKQSDPINDTLYIVKEDFKTASYDTDKDKYMYHRLFSFNVGYTEITTTNTETEIFEIPIPYDNLTHIDLRIIGHKTSTPAHMFYINTSETFIDIDGTSYKLDNNFSSSMKTNSSMNDCDAGINSSNYVFIKGISGTSITWLIRAVITH